jgi:chromate transporter
MSEQPGAASRVSLGAIFWTFLVIGATSFGGGMVAYLREILVSRRRWLDDDDFIVALEIGQTLPGLNSTNVSIIVGDSLRRVPGAVAAFLGVILPGTVLLLTVGVFLGMQSQSPALVAVLDGAGAAAVGLLVAVTIQVGRKELDGVTDVLLVLVTVLAVSVFRVPLPLVLLTVGPVAVWLYRPGGRRA